EVEDLLLLGLETAPHVDDQHDAAERRPPAKVALDEGAPGDALALGTDREAVAGQVDEHEALVHLEEVELPRAPRRRARPREPATADQAVQHRGLPDVGPAGDRHLGQSGRRLAAGPRRRAEEAGLGDPHARNAQPAARFCSPGASPRARFTARTWVT